MTVVIEADESISVQVRSRTVRILRTLSLLALLATLCASLVANVLQLQRHRQEKDELIELREKHHKTDADLRALRDYVNRGDAGYACLYAKPGN